jgi:hypothetical protein
VKTASKQRLRALVCRIGDVERAMQVRLALAGALAWPG